MMHCSMEKLDAVMGFWVGRLGWDRSTLIAYPSLFLFSLEKRALVLQQLLSRGLVKKDASFVTPFVKSDEGFLKKYVRSFTEETPWLLELYQKGQGAS
ncbi:hypothetical protein VIGAN_03092800 [Vigna angularis var. angularis]|nr:hypothetical protein VIGAN_03092800 [Vigna angularis var. angularis]